VFCFTDLAVELPQENGYTENLFMVWMISQETSFMIVSFQLHCHV